MANNDKLTKAEMIRRIGICIAEYKRLRGSNVLPHREYSKATLNTKNTDLVADELEMWERWLREEIRINRGIDRIPAELSNAIVSIVEEQETNDNAAIEEYEAAKANAISNILLVLEQMTLSSLDGINVEADCAYKGEVTLRIDFGSLTNTIYYKHRTVNFGTMGGFSLDSEKGRKQAILMGLISNMAADNRYTDYIDNWLNVISTAYNHFNERQLNNHFKADTETKNTIKPYIQSLYTK